MLCETKKDAEAIVATLKGWLGTRGLKLNQEKTKIIHITEGFDFLGFNVRHYRDISRKTDYKLLIKPNRQAIKDIKLKIKQVWLKYQAQDVKTIVAKLNPIIRGWANYYKVGVSRKVFESLDSWMYIRARRYAKRMHPKKNEAWREKRYFGRFNLERNDKWVFGVFQSGIHLLKFTWFTH